MEDAGDVVHLLRDIPGNYRADYCAFGDGGFDVAEAACGDLDRFRAIQPVITGARLTKYPEISRPARAMPVERGHEIYEQGRSLDRIDAARAPGRMPAVLSGLCGRVERHLFFVAEGALRGCRGAANPVAGTRLAHGREAVHRSVAGGPGHPRRSAASFPGKAVCVFRAQHGGDD